MTDRLIDTNILVYAYDTSEGIKHEVSNQLLKQIWEQGGGVVCIQNLAEFFVVITRKVSSPISIVEAKVIIEDMINSENWWIIDRDVNTLLSAIDLVSQYRIHFWDAMIVVCMKDYGITDIVTENKKDFEVIPDINVIFPF
jgi:predicted nucleic acid-binding protein